MYTQILEMFNEIISKPWASLLVIGTICLIEICLSLDNSAVLAIMVKDLAPAEQKKVLRYGLLHWLS
jgi:predicted tellurium resistance membrane protein TerC